MELWSSASYEAHLLSLPFALAPAAMLIVIAYTAVMRGAPVLRLYLLAHCLTLLPYATVMMLSPSITNPDVAEQLFRVATSFIPLAAATGAGLQLAMVRKYRRYRYWVWFGVANAFVWVVIGSTTNAAIDGVQWLGHFWYPRAGSWAWLALVHTVVLSVGGFSSLALAALTSKPSHERRQLRSILLANFVTYSGLVDVGLAYGVGVFPLGWLLSGVGSLLVVRALIVEDLLRVRAVDTTAPQLVLHFAGAIVLGWLCLAQLGPSVPWWGVTAVLALCFVGVRNTFATFALIDRGARGGEGPLERLVAQLVTRARSMAQAPAIAQLAIDIIDLGVGVRAQILLASEEDWGWTTLHAKATVAASLFPETMRAQTAAGSGRIDDAHAPDPLLMSWLAEYRAPLFADDLEAVPADLRAVADQLFEHHGARAIVAVRSSDEILALLVIPVAGPRLRGRSLAFVERVAERLAEAMLHARMAQKAAERAALAREVELAATVQGELLPGKGPHVHGAVAVVGSWQPATRCAGDFWGVYSLSEGSLEGSQHGGAAAGHGRVLVAIGDVTGHGVASAMVTAAAIGACDVCVRRSGAALDLVDLVAALEAAVRRVGGGELAMSCFAAILDPVERSVAYVSCGHTAPYLCRSAAADPARAIELHALVGRGNLLGLGPATVPKVHQRALEPGDLIVWYTDGVIEAQDPAGKPFGDRRLQHLLKKLDRPRLVAASAPLVVHDIVQAGVAAHRAGRPLADDETVVVAQLSHSLPAAASQATP
ncbi:MAG: serine/threonine-protein phosphatase [Deltaproteobacteria bacterium]|nr:serine/threonine-protein phosphatase [Deltaproteobacteria bacterium]MDQ3295131.1 serine/threonine-protein phosphatase [Myxococcota bacterium]